jgi:hypothetical protein
MNLQWDGDALRLNGRGPAIVKLVPDTVYAAMWRIELPGGALTDMGNRTRVKDAGLTIAAQLLLSRRAAA